MWVRSRPKVKPLHESLSVSFAKFSLPELYPVSLCLRIVLVAPLAPIVSNVLAARWMAYIFSWQ